MKRFVAAPFVAVALGIAAGSISAQATPTEAPAPRSAVPAPQSPLASCDIGGMTPNEARGARRSRLQILWNDVEEAQVSRDGDVLAVTLSGAGGVLRGERAYALTDVELRARDGSERYPAEARFIHKNAVGDKIVVGVYLTEGQANPAFETLRTAAADDDGEALAGMNPKSLLPDAEARLVVADRTPAACAPRVTWMVVDEPVEASREQLVALLNLPTDPRTRDDGAD